MYSGFRGGGFWVVWVGWWFGGDLVRFTLWVRFGGCFRNFGFLAWFVGSLIVGFGSWVGWWIWLCLLRCLFGTAWLL